VEGARAVTSASSSPSASIAASVCVGPMGRSLMPCGRLSLIFSSRPGSSSPPEKCSTSVTFTPCSSDRMPRIHTGAVIWYSGTPRRLPLRSSGLRTPLLVETKMQEWRKKRDGNAGIAMNAGLSWPSEAT
jgi:hypothetical protein